MSKLQVTDDMARLACERFYNGKTFYNLTQFDNMKAALQAVFDSLPDSANNAPTEERCSESGMLKSHCKWCRGDVKPVISKTETTEPVEEPQEDGWIEWNGGECPINPKTIVMVQYRDLVRTSPVEAEIIQWNGYHPNCVPIAYRILETKEPEKEKREPEKEKIPTFGEYLLEKYSNHTLTKYFTLTELRNLQEVSEYLDKYMRVKE
jgi:hypothetical protein